jgi:two-component system, NarL family, nitrate/nitrite response regulator NarL
MRANESASVDRSIRILTSQDSIQPSRVVVISPMRLEREGLILLLERAGLTIVGEFDSLEQVSIEVAADKLVDLFLIDTPTESPTESWIDKLYGLRERFGAASFVLLAQLATPKWLSVCLRVGIQGYLSKDREAAIFSRQIGLILSGERVYPLAAIRELAAQGGVPDLSGNTPLPAAISPSEAEVLRYLLSGFRNKMIAHKLNVRESVVKFRVKSVFQKINAVNRTQAAVWALNHGILESRNSLSAYGGASGRASDSRAEAKKLHARP